MYPHAQLFEASVSFTPPDRSAAIVSMVTIYRTANGGLISGYRLYVDPSQLALSPHYGRAA